MANQIVTLNVSVTNPPAANPLQKTGAFVSQGGTSTAAGTLTPLTSSADLAAILSGAKAITSAVWATGVVTVTTTAPHGWPNPDTFLVTISGFTPAAYNGTYTATVTGANTFTFPLASNPGSVTTVGVVTDEDVAELAQMNTTFFAQGSAVSVNVLELGQGTAAEGVTALTTYLTNNPGTIYSFLVPRTWDAEPTFKTLCGLYTSYTSKTYFHANSTTGTYSAWATPKPKSALVSVEAPGIPSSEFSPAAQFYQTLSFNPGSSTPVGPLCFRFVYGVTPYPAKGNQTLLSQLKSANVGYIYTGAEGGLSNLILEWGHTMDGKPFNFWYTVDWAQLTIQADLANEIINGSNNGIAPLYYNQDGIDRLQNRAAQTLRNGITYGLILGKVIVTQLPSTQFAANFSAGMYRGNAVINAEPFASYTTSNPGHYSTGQYNGLSAAITPARGFEQIMFNLNVTDL